jgi:hypothetical protein
MEAREHISEQLRESAEAQAAALAGLRADLQAAQALADMLAESLGSGSSAAAPFPGADQQLSQFLSSARLPAAAMSNLTALASSGQGLTPSSLEALSELLKQADGRAASQLARLCELRLVDASACRGGGSCTNASACSASLAKLLGEDSAAADAAQTLVAMCNKPGSGGVSRGRGDAMLTWSDPSTKENASFKEQSVKSGWLPDVKQSQLQGLSSSAPEVSAGTAAVVPGALGASGKAFGATPQALVLPRHREAVKRFFGEGK